MRTFLYIGAAIAILSVSPDALRCVLASTVSALFEATPFLAAGILFARIFRNARIVEYLGCGCNRGASARSLPAAAATWLVFGPFVAAARFAAALAIDRILHRDACSHSTFPATPGSLLQELSAVIPAAVVAGAATGTGLAFDFAKLSPVGDALLGALLGFTASPCGVGAVAIAGALRLRAPIATASFLCVAGILDLRALRRGEHVAAQDDAFAYALLAIALAIVAWRHGAALVHPLFVAPLACCSAGAAVCAATLRQRRCTRAALAPALMLVGALLSAPAPTYRATETTLSDLFAGERLTFTGALTKIGNVATIVRYAITCCRADASPIAVRLDRPPSYPSGTWIRVSGTIEARDGEFALQTDSLERVSSPADPFIYR